MHTGKLALLICFFVIAGIGRSQSTSRERLEKDLLFLSSDELEGRKPFSQGIQLAEHYIRERFRESGLEVLPPFRQFEQTIQARRVEQRAADSSLHLDGSPCPQAFFRANRDIQFRGNSFDLSNQFDIHDFRERDPTGQELSGILEAQRDQWVWIRSGSGELQRRLAPILDRPLVTERFSQQKVPTLIFSPCYREDPETILVKIRVERFDQTLSNTVAYLPGKHRLLAQDVVLFSAHHDHIGLSESRGGDRVFNGANDNASGIAMVLGLADYFAKQSDRQRSLIFVTFTAEEMGGLGAKRFLDALPMSAEKIVGMINFEMVGKPSIWGSGQTFLTGFDYSNLGQLLASSIPARAPFRIHPDPYPDLRLFFRSDNWHFAQQGIPAHTLSSTPIDTDPDYHQVSDEYSTLDPDHILAVMEGVIQGTVGIISGAQTPSRVEATVLFSGAP